ncbi:glycoside hydrolase family 78 protein [Pararhodonellum marinum]|uniref:glycoside hydrolase family 78 protein n=1 Tax=Pararhodonellum marinum TaxID=2755358 RepID=UPI00188EB2E6|nr:glycoside hydrolase family 78 protein [Pararhodonellum marinum]
MKWIACLFLAFFSLSQATAKLSLTLLRCENRVNPVGLDVTEPRFSWELVSDKRGTLQTAYEVRVSKTSNFKNPVWASGKVESGQSILVKYQGEKLIPNQTYHWQVRTWDNQGQVSGWSSAATFKTGYFGASDWSAQWIGQGFPEEKSRPSPYFRKEFAAENKIEQATAYISARGLYMASINGNKIGNDYLTPGWTSYHHRIQYQVYDVTELIQSGQNAVGVVLGDGWYRGSIGFTGQEMFYGDELSFLMEIVLEYADGSKQKIISDDSWTSGKGAVLSSDIYNGETFDARSEPKGWNQVGFEASSWMPVKTKDYGYEDLVATYNEPIRAQENFPVKQLFTTTDGEKVMDFGQNLVGFVRFKVRGNAGDTVKLSHAEILDKEGRFYTDNLRAAKQQITYILKGGEEEIYAPYFTFQGFRYIRLDAFPGEIKEADFTAVALYSDMETTGSFTTSHELLNQLQHNIKWGQRGNFLDVPTDCPQRDERLGWTGDAQAFSRTATFNLNVHPFFTKWLKDVALDQKEDGAIPFVVPNVIGEGATGSAGWADAATIIPWDMYLVYGDTSILETQYESMQSWVGYMENTAKNYLWNTGFHFGDWLFYRPDDDNDGRAAVTDKYLIAQCFFAHSTQIMIRTAAVLGKVEDVKKYEALLAEVKAAFLKEYLTPNGRLVSGTQTAYVLTLHFDMLPNNLRQQAADRLAENINSYGHLTTGFLGTPYLNHVLSRFGYDDLAFQLLLREKYPSWLYPVTMGATTIWERWDGIKPDGSLQTPNMNSYNHYAYGAIGDWMYQHLAGIQLVPEHPGYRQFVIKPKVGGDLTQVKGSLKTYYGEIISDWKIEEGKFNMTVQVPANTQAMLYLPSSDKSRILEGGKNMSTKSAWSAMPLEGEYTPVKLGSGNYTFEVTDWKAEELNTD